MTNEGWNLFVLAQEKSVDMETLSIYMQMATIASQWWSSRMHIENFLSDEQELDLNKIVSTYEKALRDEILKELINGNNFVLYYISGNSSNQLLMASEKSKVITSYPNNSVMEYVSGEMIIKDNNKKPKKLFSLKEVRNEKKI